MDKLGIIRIVNKSINDALMPFFLHSNVQLEILERVLQKEAIQRGRFKMSLVLKTKDFDLRRLTVWVQCDTPRTGVKNKKKEENPL